MKITMITPFHNHDGGYISLILKELDNLPEQVQVEGKVLTRKNEFHISLMAIKNLLPLINAVDKNVTENDLVQDFLEYQKEAILSEYSLTSELRYVTRNERETIVCMVKVPGIENLFEVLRAKYGVNLPTQPTHITIYTLQPNVGIGILSNDELNSDSKVVDLPELHIEKKA